MDDLLDVWTLLQSPCDQQRIAPILSFASAMSWRHAAPSCNHIRSEPREWRFGGRPGVCGERCDVRVNDGTHNEVGMTIAVFRETMEDDIGTLK